MDIGATALALAGGVPLDMRLEGVDLIPHLTGQKKEPPHNHLFWKLNSRGAIREGRYKLITAVTNPKWELYDLEADRSETKNLASEKPDLAKRLHADWLSWNAEMPPPAWKKPPESEWGLPQYQGPLWAEETVSR
jgi:arylsulfatase A-like enzyme